MSEPVQWDIPARDVVSGKDGIVRVVANTEPPQLVIQTITGTGAVIPMTQIENLALAIRSAGSVVERFQRGWPR